MGDGKHLTDCRAEFGQRQGCALYHLRETSRSSAPGAGVIVGHGERGNIAITPSPSLAGIITELGTSRLL